MSVNPGDFKKHLEEKGLAVPIPGTGARPHQKSVFSQILLEKGLTVPVPGAAAKPVPGAPAKPAPMRSKRA
jgi:hypothetical protein